MTLLLDSNALIWLLGSSPRLGLSARSLIEDEPEVCVSDVTLFEVSLKAAREKLHLPPQLGSVVEQLGIVRDVYLDRMRELPFHHRDPFDRYLIAQSLVDGVPVVTSDPAFAQYGVQVVDARL
jgi:PIN domain nuclease of toxin-antitoxin system